MKALKTVAVALGITLGAILVIPLIVLAGLFVWLKLTEEDDDVGRFMDEAIARRGQSAEPTPKHYEAQLRVIGRYLDEHHPRDIFFFELEGAYIARITVSGQGGLRQELVEFTREDIADLIAKAPALRRGNGSPTPS